MSSSSFFSSQHHSFDIAIASKYGIEEAILIHHFQHWIRINQRAKRNIKNNKCWTYQSRKEIQLHFPYWNYDRVKYLCEKLVSEGVLITENFNKSKMDKTLWYAFADEKAFGVDVENSNNVYEGHFCPSKGKSAQPIPDTKTTYIKKDKVQKAKRAAGSPSADAMRLASLLLETIKKIKPNFREPPSLSKWSEVIDLMLIKDSISEDRIKRVLSHLPSHEFWKRRILSADKLRKHFDTLELDFEADAKAVKKPESAQAAKDWLMTLKTKVENRNDITVGPQSIAFHGGQSIIEIKYTDPAWKEQVINRLRKMNIDIGGL